MHKFRRLITVNLCAVYSLYKEKYDKIESVLDNEIKSFWQNKMTLIHMGRLWVKNIFFNLSFFRCSRKLETLKTDLPVLVVGAGPSLEENTDWIRKVNRSIIIIAVDTALPYLNACDIKPDFIFILESQHINLQDFIPNTFGDIPVICDISSAPFVSKMFKNRAYLFSSDFYPLGLFKRMDKHKLHAQIIPPLGSVGVAAVYTAKMITTGPVILCGLDFSYTFNRTHAKNTAFHMLALCAVNRLESGEQIVYEAVKKRPLIRIEGKGGETVLSDLVLLFYSRRINEVVDNSGRLFDIGQKGLKTGAENIDSPEKLENLVSSFDKHSYKNSISREMPQSDVAVYRQNVYDFMLSERQILNNGIRRLKALMNETEQETGNIDFLKELDYLFFFFPDKETLPLPDKNFLARTLKSAYEFSAVIDRALSILKRGS